jgi:hypothetical protein
MVRRMPACEFPHVAGEDQRVIVRIVPRRVQERDWSGGREAGKLTDASFIGGQLVGILLPKLEPADRGVPEPFTQRWARRDLLHPYVHLCACLGDATWPQAIDQDARPIGRIGTLVNTLGSESSLLRAESCRGAHMSQAGCRTAVP